MTFEEKEEHEIQAAESGHQNQDSKASASKEKLNDKGYSRDHSQKEVEDSAEYYFRATSFVQRTMKKSVRWTERLRALVLFSLLMKKPKPRALLKTFSLSASMKRLLSRLFLRLPLFQIDLLRQEILSQYNFFKNFYRIIWYYQWLTLLLAW